MTDGIHGKWFHEYIDPSTQNAYETIQETIQTRLPNSLQDKLNKAFKSCFHQTEQKANAETICQTLTKAIQMWSKTPFAKNLKFINPDC